LNFGHSIGHAIETVTEYKQYLHGEAVAIGMHLETKLACMLGLIDTKKVVRIKSLIDAYGLPSEKPLDVNVEHILSSMELDKKAVAGKLKFILPEKIGSVRIEKGVPEKVIRDLLKS
jgi:3-dehydroquinate synthase